LYIHSVVLSYFMMAYSAFYVSYLRFPYFGSGAGFHAMNSTELLYYDTKIVNSITIVARNCRHVLHRVRISITMTLSTWCYRCIIVVTHGEEG
jgi:hypothetical protein